MYKRTASSSAFFPRIADHSTKGSRRGYDLLDHGVNAASVLTPEERRRSLVAAVHKIEGEILALPYGSADRRALGQQKLRLCLQINEIRAKSKGVGRTVQQAFIDIARERLPAGLFNAIMKQAAERATDSSTESPK